VVARGNAPPDDHAQALRQAEEACRIEPGEPNFINTLGVALYRTDRFQESVNTLTRSNKIHSARSAGRDPGDVAFLAELRQLMKQPQWAGDAQDQSFLREATELIEGKR
jgi:uncharacterized protein HemY